MIESGGVTMIIWGSISYSIRLTDIRAFPCKLRIIQVPLWHDRVVPGLDKITFQFGGTDDNSEIGVYISIFVVVYNQAMF